MAQAANQTSVTSAIGSVAARTAACLAVARWTNLLPGRLALIFSLSIPNVMDILIAAYDFWAPTVFVPLAAALLGFRLAPRTFYAAVVPCVAGTIARDRLLNRLWGVRGFVIGTLLALASFLVANATLRKKNDA